VFVVGCLGDWESAAKVLFEPESLRGDIKKSKSKGKDVASFTPSSFGQYSEGVGTVRANGGDLGGGSETLYVPNTARCLTRGVAQKNDFETDTFITQVYENHGTDSRVKPVEICPTVTSRWGTGGNNVPLAQVIPLKDPNDIACDPKRRQNGIGETGDPAFTLRTSVTPGVAYSIQGNMIGRSDTAGPQGTGVNEEISFTLNTTNRHCMAQPIGSSKISGALRANPGSGWRSDGTPVEAVVIHNTAVRKLTPIECERLQGFPDDYTNIKPKCPDGPRYKAMGNSMAVPVMRWIGQRIESVAR
jgi:DNA (cytosine-5)-methyltransferase 1